MHDLNCKEEDDSDAQMKQSDFMLAPSGFIPMDGRGRNDTVYQNVVMVDDYPSDDQDVV